MIEAHDVDGGTVLDLRESDGTGGRDLRARMVLGQVAVNGRGSGASESRVWVVVGKERDTKRDDSGLADNPIRYKIRMDLSTREATLPALNEKLIVAYRGRVSPSWIEPNGLLERRILLGAQNFAPSAKGDRDISFQSTVVMDHDTDGWASYRLVVANHEYGG
ncbi:hypothetical protein B0H19DRAFT_1068400 [Mycena capillaripes]|nr:hypothetical protein B0H19DRAFT_1068400 [Mycena capillaripes]